MLYKLSHKSTSCLTSLQAVSQVKLIFIQDATNELTNLYTELRNRLFERTQ